MHPRETYGFYRKPFRLSHLSHFENLDPDPSASSRPLFRESKKPYNDLERLLFVGT